MNTLNVSAAMRMCALVFGLFVLLSAAPALAQNSTSTQEGGGTSTSTQTTKSTSTSTTSQPTQTTRTWVDPFWLILGGIALLAIILIAIFASRGRGRDRTAVVHERETVIKKE
jgi:hypothetical protein